MAGLDSSFTIWTLAMRARKAGLVENALALSAQQVVWSYEIVKKDRTRATLTLDARIDTEHVMDSTAKARVAEWVKRSGQFLNLNSERIGQLRGAVFEARQGYKSADAKRSNADLGFGMNAASENYIPVLAVISTQASSSVLRRYRNNKMLVMTGTLADDDTTSTFAFFRKVIGFDLDKFFERNMGVMRERCNRVLEALLSAKQASSPETSTAVTVKKKRPRKS